MTRLPDSSPRGDYGQARSWPRRDANSRRGDSSARLALALFSLACDALAVLAFFQLVYIPHFPLVVPGRYVYLAPPIGGALSLIAALAAGLALISALRHVPLNQRDLTLSIIGLTLGVLAGVAILSLSYFYWACSVSC